ncbi:hypothetical protein MTO96_001676 [Rhipicephalus appendiculatus]
MKMEEAAAGLKTAERTASSPFALSRPPRSGFALARYLRSGTPLTCGHYVPLPDSPPRPAGAPPANGDARYRSASNAKPGRVLHTLQPGVPSQPLGLSVCPGFVARTPFNDYSSARRGKTIFCTLHVFLKHAKTSRRNWAFRHACQVSRQTTRAILERRSETPGQLFVVVET